MQTNIYAADLQVLPETEEEKALILEFLAKNTHSKPVHYFSNVEGQPWYGRTFIEMPFRSGLKDQLIDFVNNAKYINQQFERLGAESSEYTAKIQIHKDGNKTNFLSISDNQLKQIKEILLYTK